MVEEPLPGWIGDGPPKPEDRDKIARLLSGHEEPKKCWCGALLVEGCFSTTPKCALCGLSPEECKQMNVCRGGCF